MSDVSMWLCRPSLFVSVIMYVYLSVFYHLFAYDLSSYSHPSIIYMIYVCITFLSPINQHTCHLFIYYLSIIYSNLSLSSSPLPPAHSLTVITFSITFTIIIIVTITVIITMLFVSCGRVIVSPSRWRPLS